MMKAVTHTRREMNKMAIAENDANQMVQIVIMMPPTAEEVNSYQS